MNHEEFDWKQALSGDPNQERGFDRRLQQQIERLAAQGEKPRMNRIRSQAPVAILATAAVVLLSAGGWTVWNHWQTPQHPTTTVTPEPITDTITRQELPVIAQPDPAWITKKFGTDGMMRKRTELLGDIALIDLNAYKNAASLQRGDVVYYKERRTPRQGNDDEVARIVGLPGEQIKIEQGQVYINNRKLDTFYGHEYNNGAYVENSQTAIPEQSIGLDQVFVLGDNWWRYGGMRNPIPIQISDVQGKVVGIQPDPQSGGQS